MDFFEGQDLARRRSTQLTLLFSLAVVGVCAAVYALALLVWHGLFAGPGAAVITGRYDAIEPLGFRAWQPEVFFWSVGSTLLLISLGTLYKSAQLRSGGGAVAQALGGRRVDPASTVPEERRLLNVIEEMAIASGTPVPEVYLLDQEIGINAFAAGKTPSDAAIGVTRGTVQLLARDELQGVIAHEFSHIFNGDSRLNLRALGLLHGVFLVALLGRLILRGARYSSRKEGAGGVTIGLGLLLIGSIGVFFGRLIQAAISRQREILADASAVQFTRDPDGLAGALKKIGGLATGSYLKVPQADEASHMFFSNGVRRLPLFSSLFRTHPPLEERIVRLQPHWDGEFPEVQLPSIGAGLGEQAQEQASGEQEPSLSGFVERPSAAEVRQALEHIGQPRPEEIVAARGMHAGVQESWVAAAREQREAQALVFGLLLGRDRAQARQEAAVLERRTDARTVALAERFAEETRGRPSAEKIALVDIAIGTLRGLSAPEYRRFIDAMDAMIRRDGRVDLFEYAISACIRRHLGRYFDHLGQTPIRFRKLKDLLPDTELLLSTLARLGARSDEQAQRAFEAAAQALGLGPATLSFRPPAECTLQAVELALLRYDAATPALKKSLMRACGASVIADERVSDREAELIRVIGDSIDCPVPPFVGSQR
jgi:Zn-dependent protease with chaperone function